jgi:Na+/H+ antiporter NhaD/arsenite permease-like protein
LASPYVFVAAASVFVLTYALISLRQLARFPLERPASAMLGAALMLALGVVPPSAAAAAINVELILLLVGMMILVSSLDACGFFDAVSNRIVSHARTQASLLALLMLVTAALSALVLNDTIALLLTPIVVKSTRTLRVNPVPYLVGLAIAVNVGSVASEIGNPQNAYIAIRSGIRFLDFAVTMVPIALVCLAVSIVLARLAFRRDLARPVDPPRHVPATPVQRRGVALTLGTTVGVVAAIFLTGPEWLPFVAIVGGSLTLFFVPFVTKATPRGLLARVDWGIIVFFVGLFVVLEGVRTSGLSEAIQISFGSVFGSGGGLGQLAGLSALLSNLISNVPAVLLLAETVEASGGSPALWLTLAASSTLAGNATIIGAAANVIVVQAAAREGIHVSMKDFVRAGLPVTAATLVLSAILIGFLAPA